MRFKDCLEPEAVDLDLPGKNREEVFAHLVGLLRLDAVQTDTVVRQLIRREVLGSTGFGGGVAIPHCRTPAVSRLRCAFGRHRTGIDLQALDGQPVRIFFLIVAPPVEVSNQYLQVLAQIAQFIREAEIPDRLAGLGSREELLQLLNDRQPG